MAWQMREIFTENGMPIYLRQFTVWIGDSALWVWWHEGNFHGARMSEASIDWPPNPNRIYKVGDTEFRFDADMNFCWEE